MARKYYTLCERQPGQLWTPEFGDYSLKVVEQERRDMKDSGSFIKGTQFLIVDSDGTQKMLTEKVEALNVKARSIAQSEQNLQRAGFTAADLKRHAKHNEKVAQDARRKYGAGPD